MDSKRDIEFSVNLDNRAAEEKLHKLTVDAYEIESAFKGTEESYKKMVDVVASIDQMELIAQAVVQALEQQRNTASRVADETGKTAEETEKTEKATSKAEKFAQNFAKKMKEAAKVKLSSVWSAAGSAFKNWATNLLKVSDMSAGAIAQLKGALLTLVQPLASVIVPAFTAIANVATAVVGKAAQILARLFGTTTESTTESAEALNEETKALKGVSGAAKETAKNLSGLDEVSTWNGGKSGGAVDKSVISPDFSWADSISPSLEKIAEDVLMIAAGLALWKISTLLPEKLGAVGTTLGGIMIAIGGLLLLWDGLADAWQNGVNWENLAAVIGGVAAAAVGLYIAFGHVGAGIALIVGSIAMLVLGFKDAMENGFNLQNGLLILGGILAAGLGISLLAGSWIPMLIAGITAVLAAITIMTGNGEQLIGNLKQVFGGLLQFVKGVFSGDWASAWEGIKNVFKGIVNTMATLFGSMVNLAIRGLNWLIAKIRKISFTVPEWVPGIGGKTAGFGWIQDIPEWQIPQLATGAVIPPNREFLAILGDQRSGTNIETPEGLLRQIMREELGGRGNTYQVNATANGRNLFRLVIDEAKGEQMRTGRNPFMLT